MILEIFVIVVGIIIFIAGFIIPEKFTGESKRIARQSSLELRNILEEELNEVKIRVDSIVEGTMDEVAEQTEKSLEKISNEKIMAVNDYTSGVMEEIQKTHNEVMFLYSMLNDKEKELKDLMTKIHSLTEENITNHQAAETEMSEEQENKNSVNQASGIHERIKLMDKYEIKNQNNRILSLFEEGKNEIEIAKKLGLGIGEVRLVLDLFKGAKE